MSRIRANQITNKGANGAPNFPNGLTITGVATATTLNANVTGDLTVSGDIGCAGTITYEDVARVDATGISTFREGFNLGPLAGIALTAYKDGSIRTSGIVTAASFVGDGSGLTGAGPSLANGVNNRVITASSATALNGEANLTFDGTTLTSATEIKVQGGSGDTILKLHRTNAAGSNGNTFGNILWSDNNANTVAQFRAVRETAVDDASLVLSTRPTGGSITERLRVGSAGQLGIAGANYGSSGQVLTSGGASAAPTWGTGFAGTHYLAYSNDHSHTTTVDINGANQGNGTGDNQRDCVVINNSLYHTVTPSHNDDIIVMGLQSTVYSNWGSGGSYWGLGFQRATDTGFSANRSIFYHQGQHSNGNGSGGGDEYRVAQAVHQFKTSDISLTTGTTYHIRGIGQVHNNNTLVRFNNNNGTNNRARFNCWIRHYKRNV